MGFSSKTCPQTKFSHRLLIQNISTKNIAVIGDLILDEYTFGEISRISPEAPVPVMKISRRDWKLGGSGNVLLNLKALEMNCYAFGRIGNDRNGQMILSLLDGVVEDKELIQISNAVPTITKNRVVANNQQVVRLDDEKVEQLNAEEEKKVLDAFKNLLHNISAVILSDYGKGFLTRNLLQQIIELSRKANIPVIVDPKGRDFSIYSGATVITPNNKEAAAAAPLCTSLQSTAEKLLDDARLDFLMITRGQDGISYFARDTKRVSHEHYPIEAQSVIDVTGAGDTVVAVTAMCLANGIPHDFLCRYCNIAAGYVVAYFGAATISLGTLRDLVMPGTTTVDRDLKTVKNYIEKKKSADAKIVFTDLCQDFITPKELDTLRKAKEQGDVLIVGIHNDQSLQSSGKEKGPLMDEHQRLDLVNELRCVDLAFLMKEMSPLDSVRHLSPDLIIVNKEKAKAYDALPIPKLSL